MKQKILVVDDSEFMREMVIRTLGEDYILYCVTCAEQAIAFLQNDIPHMILLDVTMTGMSGFEFFEYIKKFEATKDIPVVFLALESLGAEKIKAIEMGAVDYIAKPFTQVYLKKRVNLFSRLISNQIKIKEKNERLERFSRELQNMVDSKTQKIVALQDALIRTTGEVIDCRDSSTGGHIRRTVEYVTIIAERAAQEKIYSNELNETSIRTMKRVAPLHDVGKIKIPDSILLKPGKLTEYEFELMKTHTTLGTKIIDQISIGAGNSADMALAKIIALNHHEKWDGSGYPNSISEYEIPLSGRIMAIADVFDALVSKRIYKPAFSFDDAVEIINNESGMHFDPQLIVIFNKVSPFLKIVLNQYNK